MGFMNTNEIETVAATLANQLEANISVREAVWRLSKVQPKHAAVWTQASANIGSGSRLSEQLEELWPEELIASVKAGEEAGHVAPVLYRIQKAMEIKRSLNKTLTKLISPVVSGLGGFGVFLFFMIGVIPKMQESLGGAETSWVFKVSTWMHHVAYNYWPGIAIGSIFLGIMGWMWLNSKEAKDTMLRFADQLPALGVALRKLNFGLWAHYVSVLASAGLPVKVQLVYSARTLPELYRDGVLLIADEVEKRGLADASDPDKQVEDDPRQQIPFYISAAFMNAHETGQLAREMDRVAPILLEEGGRDLTRIIGALDIVAKLVAASLIGLPMVAYFTQLSSALTKAFS